MCVGRWLVIFAFLWRNAALMCHRAVKLNFLGTLKMWCELGKNGIDAFHLVGFMKRSSVWKSVPSYLGKARLSQRSVVNCIDLIFFWWILRLRQCHKFWYISTGTQNFVPFFTKFQSSVISLRLRMHSSSSNTKYLWGSKSNFF